MHGLSLFSGSLLGKEYNSPLQIQSRFNPAMPANSPPRIALAREAMATRFEIVLYGDDLVSLRAAGEEALNEIERLDKQLNLYNPASEIASINARAAREPVRVEPGLWQLLEDAQRL